MIYYIVKEGFINTWQNREKFIYWDTKIRIQIPSVQQLHMQILRIVLMMEEDTWQSEQVRLTKKQNMY